jgi:choloylglycine hydrolase
MRVILKNRPVLFSPPSGPVGGVVHSNYTMLTVARDPQNLRDYYKSYDDQTIRMVDLGKLDVNATTIKMLSTKSEQPVVDMSDQVK